MVLTAEQKRLQDALVHIERNPKKYSQDAWIGDCGTVACLAGRIALNEGAVPVPAPVHSGEYANVRTPQGRLISVGQFAEDLLGISDVEGQKLFDEKNTVADLWAHARRITNGAVNRRDAMRS